MPDTVSVDGSSNSRHRNGSHQSVPSKCSSGSRHSSNEQLFQDEHPNAMPTKDSTPSADGLPSSEEQPTPLPPPQHSTATVEEPAISGEQSKAPAEEGTGSGGMDYNALIKHYAERIERLERDMATVRNTTLPGVPDSSSHTALPEPGAFTSIETSTHSYRPRSLPRRWSEISKKPSRRADTYDPRREHSRLPVYIPEPGNAICNICNSS
jgi:hypothetical protein